MMVFFLSTYSRPAEPHQPPCAGYYAAWPPTIMRVHVDVAFLIWGLCTPALLPMMTIPRIWFGVPIWASGFMCHSTLYSLSSCTILCAVRIFRGRFTTCTSGWLCHIIPSQRWYEQAGPLASAPHGILHFFHSFLCSIAQVPKFLSRTPACYFHTEHIMVPLRVDFRQCHGIFGCLD